MSNYTHQQLARISELDTAIDAAADKGDDAFFAAVAAKDEYIDSQGIDRDRLEVTGREAQGNVQNFAGKQAGQSVKSFEIGEIQFSAVRTLAPRPHWRLRVNETGEVFEAGAGGISNESVPKMQADIQYLLERISKGDTADFRRRFGLPERSLEHQLAKQVVGHGQALDALAAGQTVGNVEASNGRFAAGDWLHLFGVGGRETHCRVVIDCEKEELVVASERVGAMHFQEIRGARFRDLAESVISANEAHKNPEEYGLERCALMPAWAAAILVERDQKVGSVESAKEETIQEQPGVRFEPRDLTATHPDDYPTQEYDVIAITSDGKVRHSEPTFDTLALAQAACEEFSKGESSLDLWTDVPHGMVLERGSVEVGTDRGRDYQYKVLVNNAEFMKGDAGSVGILFGNLSGKNFTQRPGHDQTHAEWLAYMSAEYSTELQIGAHIQLCNPDGTVLLESEIGEELPAQRPRSDSMSPGM